MLHHSKKLTRKQVEAIYSIYHRDWYNHEKPSYTSFRRTCCRALDGCIMVPWLGMWLGVEEDGYTHS
jgi:hypothetical protein